MVSQLSVSVQTRHISSAMAMSTADSTREIVTILWSGMLVTEVCTPEEVVDISVAKTSAANSAMTPMGSLPMNHAVGPLAISSMLRERSERPM